MNKHIRLILVTIFVTLAMTVALYLLGRTPICECGTIKLWHSFTKSSQNSQHLFDPYSLTHVAHGIALYFVLWLVLKKLDLAKRFLLAYSLEALWEVIENTNAVISRYRAATISFDYFGDSIVNSVGDLLSMSFGFVIAAHLPIVVTVTTFALIEITLLYAIKDSFLLNVIMLIHPVQAFKHWQSS